MLGPALLAAALLAVLGAACATPAGEPDGSDSGGEPVDQLGSDAGDPGDASARDAPVDREIDFGEVPEARARSCDEPIVADADDAGDDGFVIVEGNTDFAFEGAGDTVCPDPDEGGPVQVVKFTVPRYDDVPEDGLVRLVASTYEGPWSTYVDTRLEVRTACDARPAQAPPSCALTHGRFGAAVDFYAAVGSDVFLLVSSFTSDRAGPGPWMLSIGRPARTLEAGQPCGVTVFDSRVTCQPGLTCVANDRGNICQDQCLGNPAVRDPLLLTDGQPIESTVDPGADEYQDVCELPLEVGSTSFFFSIVGKGRVEASVDFPETPEGVTLYVQSVGKLCGPAYGETACAGGARTLSLDPVAMGLVGTVAVRVSLREAPAVTAPVPFKLRVTQEP